jgi:UTP-glucose-1-phosphate uridylyltransferase
LIKFVLHSRDYENLKLLNQKSGKGTTQYVFTFEYPEGMEPFPVPKELMQKYQEPEEVKQQISEEPEKNFIVLTEVKAKDGIIEDFVPTLKDRLADKINDMLNECEFQKAQKDFSVIMPNYSPKNAIYCVCGEVLEVSSIQVCNWRDEFKFYLFEGEECDCGEKVYALSVMDDSDQIPAKLKDIFRS